MEDIPQTCNPKDCQKTLKDDGCGLPCVVLPYLGFRCMQMETGIQNIHAMYQNSTH